MISVWFANYNGVEIRIKKSWLKGESLYVDGKLQDQQMNAFSSVLTGKISTLDSVKSIKADLPILG
jgi:hypothetical protein